MTLPEISHAAADKLARPFVWILAFEWDLGAEALDHVLVQAEALVERPQRLLDPAGIALKVLIQLAFWIDARNLQRRPK